MKRLQRAALLTELVEQMRAHDSWCGETHLQKATYFLQELLDVEMDYDFVLYKHGPFSFDLRDELGGFVSSCPLEPLCQGNIAPANPAVRAAALAVPRRACRYSSSALARIGRWKLKNGKMNISSQKMWPR